jgi:SNF family Na+-dependent transporter
MDTFTAFLAGFVIFATLGFMAGETQSSIESVVTDGNGSDFLLSKLLYEFNLNPRLVYAGGK